MTPELSQSYGKKMFPSQEKCRNTNGKRCGNPITEKTVGTNRYYIAKAQNDRVDMLIEVQQNRSISAATDEAEIDGVYYRIVQVQQVIDEDGIPMTDLALERGEGLE